MCCLKFFFSKPISKILTNPIVLNEPVIVCQLCNLTYQVCILQCKHALCKGCIETQKLYIYEPCLICEDKCWSDIIPSS